MILLLLCFLPSAIFSMLTIWPFGPPLRRLLLRWRLHKELFFDWSAGLSTVVFLSIRADMKPPSQWIPTELTSSSIFYSTIPFDSIPLQLSSGLPTIVLFPFLNMYPRFRPSSSLVSRPYAVSRLPHGAPFRSPSLFCIKLLFSPFSLMLHLDGLLFSGLSTLPNWNAVTEWPVAPSLPASCPPLSHFSETSLPPYDSP